MIEVPNGYQDAHGFTYNGGVILINHMSHSAHQSVQMNLVLDAEAINYNSTGLSAGAQLGFTAVIYPSAQALTERRPPLQFKPQGHPDYFNITLQNAVEANQLLGLCEQWLMDNILTGGE